MRGFVVAFGLIMRNIGRMWPRAIRRRADYAPGLALLAAMCMPAPLWAGDYTLAWRDGAWRDYESPRVAVNGVALSPFADMHRHAGEPSLE